MNTQRGVGTLEFAVVLTVFGILAAMLFDRLAAVERDTERLQVDLTIRHIHIGLKLAIGEKIMRGDETRIATLLDKNPLDFLGEAEKVGAGETARWHYDSAQRLLSYRPRQPDAFANRHQLDWRYTGHRDELGRMVGLQLEGVPSPQLTPHPAANPLM